MRDVHVAWGVWGTRGVGWRACPEHPAREPVQRGVGTGARVELEDCLRCALFYVGRIEHGCGKGVDAEMDAGVRHECR